MDVERLAELRLVGGEEAREFWRERNAGDWVIRRPGADDLGDATIPELDPSDLQPYEAAMEEYDEVAFRGPRIARPEAPIVHLRFGTDG